MSHHFNFRKPLIIMDLEMSGLDPLTNQITEIAALRCDPKNLGVSSTFSKKCGAAHGKSAKQVMREAHPVALEKTGLSLKQLEFCASPEDVVNEFIEWLPKEYVFVGFNLMLDFMFLTEITVPEKRFHYRFIDLTTVAELYFSRTNKKDLRSGYSLTDAAQALGIKVENAHNALDDAETCRKLLQKLLKDFK